MADSVRLTNNELRTEDDVQVSINALADLDGFEPEGDFVSTPAEPVEVAAVPETAATSDTPFGYSEAQANAIVTQLNLVIGILQDAGLAAVPE